MSGISAGHLSVGRTKRPVWELRVLRREGDRIVLLFLQAPLAAVRLAVCRRASPCVAVRRRAPSGGGQPSTCQGPALLWICGSSISYSCNGNGRGPAILSILSIFRMPNLVAESCQARLKYCILSFARVIDIDASAARQVKTSVEKAARPGSQPLGGTRDFVAGVECTCTSAE